MGLEKERQEAAKAAKLKKMDSTKEVGGGGVSPVRAHAEVSEECHAAGGAAAGVIDCDHLLCRPCLLVVEIVMLLC